MKLLVVVYKFGTPEEVGGKALGSYDYFLSQLMALKEKGVELIVLAPWVSWLEKGSVDFQGIRIKRYFPKLAQRSLRNLLFYKLINRFYIWQTSRMAVKIAQEGKVDAIYVRQARETGAAIARAKPQLEKIPIIFQPITTWQWHFQDAKDNFLQRIAKDTKTQQKYAKEILSRFDYFITYNRSMAREYVGMGAEEQKFAIIPGAVNHEMFAPMENQSELREKLGFPRDKKVLLYIGRINFAEKGVDYLLRAVALSRQTLPDIFLALIGPGPETEVEKLRQMMANLGLNDSAHYFGSKVYSIIPEYINAADIGVVPSVWFESSGRTSLDMLSCGLPVIVTGVGGLPEYSKDGVTGVIVPPKDEKALADGIVKILSDNALRKHLSQGARQHVTENYTFEKTTEKFVEFFKEVARSKK